jgi:hypothetical protein
LDQSPIEFPHVGYYASIVRNHGGEQLQTTGKVTLDGKRRSPQKVRKTIKSGELERIRIEAMNTDKKTRVATPARRGLPIQAVMPDAR